MLNKYHHQILTRMKWKQYTHKITLQPNILDYWICHQKLKDIKKEHKVNQEDKLIFFISPVVVKILI